MENAKSRFFFEINNIKKLCEKSLDQCLAVYIIKSHCLVSEEEKKDLFARIYGEIGQIHFLNIYNTCKNYVYNTAYNL